VIQSLLLSAKLELLLLLAQLSVRVVLQQQRGTRVPQQQQQLILQQCKDGRNLPYTDYRVLLVLLLQLQRSPQAAYNRWYGYALIMASNSCSRTTTMPQHHIIQILCCFKHYEQDCEYDCISAVLTHSSSATSVTSSTITTSSALAALA
jgi:hypothetical protein